MPITFANPGLLLGMLAAALPILVHFLSRRRILRLAFSDLRFLESVQAQQARSLNLRRLLLLLLRVLIILLIVLGAARPQVAGLAPGSEGARSVVFLLDTSASMQTQQEDGTRFESAVRLCLEMIDGLPRDSEVQVLNSGPNSTPLFAAWMPASGPIGEALQSCRPTDGLLDLAGALQEAARWAAIARTRPAQIVLISDLQKVPGDRQALQDVAERLNGSSPIHLLIRQVGTQVPNGGVQSVRLPLRAVRPDESVTIRAEVHLEHADQVFWLELDGRRLAEAVAAGEAGQTVDVEFAVTIPEPGFHRGLVLKQSDRLPADDVRPFVLKVWRQVSVLLAHGADRDPTGRGGWRYLAKALQPEPERNGLFRVREMTSGDMGVGDLLSADALLFVDPDPLGRQLLGGLLEWVDGGGGVAFLVGDPTLQSYLEQILLPALGMPVPIDFRVRSQTGYETVSLLAPDHPVFYGLGSEPLATLGDIPWRRYFALPEGDSRVLLSFTSEAPAMLEGRYGRGVFVLLPFHLTPEASTLSLSPMFLPLVQRLTAYLAQHRENMDALEIPAGQRPLIHLRESRVRTDSLNDVRALTVAGPFPDVDRAPAELFWRQGEPALIGPVAGKQGFYTFAAGEDTLGIVAAVVPASECEPELWPVKEFRAFLASAGLSQTADLADVATADIAGALRGKDVSLWLFALAVILLCVELYLARGSGRPASAA